MLETRKLFTNVTCVVEARGVCALSVAPRGSAPRRAAAALLCAMVTYGSYVVAQRGRKSRRGGQKHKRGASLSTTAPRLGNKPSESSRLAWSWASPFWAVSRCPPNVKAGPFRAEPGAVCCRSRGCLWSPCESVASSARMLVSPAAKQLANTASQLCRRSRNYALKPLRSSAALGIRFARWVFAFSWARGR